MSLKPDRPPDFVSRVGHAFWWNEMIFMHVFGGFYKIEMEQSEGKYHGAFFFWEEGPKKIFLPGVREEYDKWWHESFEINFLGEE
jgi:hypothetical protein